MGKKRKVKKEIRWKRKEKEGKRKVRNISTFVHD